MGKITYFAVKEQMVEGRLRLPGDLIPEAASWKSINFYLEARTIYPVLVSTLPRSQREEVTEWETRQGAEMGKKAYPQSEAHRSTIAPGDVAFDDGKEVEPLKTDSMHPPKVDVSPVEKDKTDKKKDDDEDDADDSGDIESYSTQRKADLKAELDHRGIAYEESDLKEALISKLEADDQKTESDHATGEAHSKDKTG